MIVSDAAAEELLDLIYDASHEPDLWRTILTKIADATASTGGVLFGQTPSQVYFDYNGRLSEDCNRVYKARHLDNPWNRAMTNQPVGRVVLSDSVVPLDALRRTSFFDEVLKPQDTPHNTMMALAAKQDFVVAFNICRSARQGPMNGADVRLIQLLAPHMTRSMHMAFRFHGYGALQRAEYLVLDRLAVGVVLLAASRRVLYANAAARSHGRDGGPLRLRQAGISVASQPHAQKLGELIRLALLGAPVGTMTIPQTAELSLLTLLVTPLRGRDIERLGDLGMRDAAVLIFIIDPANKHGLPEAWVRDAYGLTTAEAKVALAAGSGLSIPEVAQKLGLSPNTVKTHLRKVFAKTATSRQAELARLMASLAVVEE
jgi:DNA-binding CsgD family transcriptional regulator